jgi:hypothetical protein
MARAGSQSQFEQAADDLLCYAGLKIQPREIERVAEDVGRQVEHWLCGQQNQLLQGVGTPAAPLQSIPKFYVSFDGTGIPVRKNELLGRKGKQSDGSARTRLQIPLSFTPRFRSITCARSPSAMERRLYEYGCKQVPRSFGR